MDSEDDLTGLAGFAAFVFPLVCWLLTAVVSYRYIAAYEDNRTAESHAHWGKPYDAPIVGRGDGDDRLRDVMLEVKGLERPLKVARETYEVDTVTSLQAWRSSSGELFIGPGDPYYPAMSRFEQKLWAVLIGLVGWLIGLAIAAATYVFGEGIFYKKGRSARSCLLAHQPRQLQ